jgi:hypothetical protein
LDICDKAEGAKQNREDPDQGNRINNNNL